MEGSFAFKVNHIWREQVDNLRTVLLLLVLLWLNTVLAIIDESFKRRNEFPFTLITSPMLSQIYETFQNRPGNGLMNTLRFGYPANVKSKVKGLNSYLA